MTHYGLKKCALSFFNFPTALLSRVAGLSVNAFCTTCFEYENEWAANCRVLDMAANTSAIIGPQALQR
jgi:hypothetical protein